jgi:hypothetical protein
MSRSLSTAFRSALAAQETGEAILLLLEIDHSELATPIRVSSDNVNTTSNGEVFVAYPFILKLPNDDNTEGPPVASLQIDNVDQSLTTVIRNITTPPTCRIMVVLGSDPDTLEMDLPGFSMIDISANVTTISAQLTIENYMAEPFPGNKFMPSTFPGLF